MYVCIHTHACLLYVYTVLMFHLHSITFRMCSVIYAYTYVYVHTLKYTCT